MRTITRLVALALTILCVPVSARTQQPASIAPYRVIVHPRNPTSSVSRRFLADAFLKKVTRWRHGDAIRPVDLPSGSSARRRFVQDVLHRSVEAIRSYWQQQIFSGRGLPPAELDGDAAVIRYVLRNRGAIGYVSGAATVQSVKVVNVY